MPTDYDRGWREGYIEGMKQWQERYDRSMRSMLIALVALAIAAILLSGGLLAVSVA